MEGLKDQESLGCLVIRMISNLRYSDSVAQTVAFMLPKNGFDIRITITLIQLLRTGRLVANSKSSLWLQ